MADLNHDDFNEWRYDLTDHFLDCCKLSRYLTMANDSRFVISDDFRCAPVLPAAAAVAAIYSPDARVAQAAILPLGHSVGSLSARERDRYERLFALIEREILSDDVRGAAGAIHRVAVPWLGSTLRRGQPGPPYEPGARYRSFLAIVRRLMDGQVSAGAFIDEFCNFTRAITGKLDFGIYSFCLDRIFTSPLIPEQNKKLLVL